MIADLLASLRGEHVAALDLNPGQPSLTDLAQATPATAVPALLAGATPVTAGARGRGRLDVITHGAPADGQVLGDAEYRRLFDILEERYVLTLADPGASAVARVLAAADQLVLVAPASPDAARAVAMTQEWLDGHGYGELSAGSVTVINGVSKRSMTHVEQAELVVRGRCRAIVRVPWDDHLGAPQAERGIRDCRPAADSRAHPVPGPQSGLAQLRPQVQGAYTALAGVLVDILAADHEQRRASR
jgi:MinD-like ATPase involved in chromosome partitioning or flagellar assembly